MRLHPSIVVQIETRNQRISLQTSKEFVTSKRTYDNRDGSIVVFNINNGKIQTFTNKCSVTIYMKEVNK